jgi:hypothetical protein
LFHLCASGPGCFHLHGVFGRCAPPETHPRGWPGITGLRRLPKTGSCSSRRKPPFGSRGFSPRELHPCTAAADGLSPRCRPPASFDWESRLSLPRALPSPVVHTVPLRGFHLSEQRAHRPPRRPAHDVRPDQDCSPADRLRSTRSPPRTTSIGSIQVFQPRMLPIFKAVRLVSE